MGCCEGRPERPNDEGVASGGQTLSSKPMSEEVRTCLSSLMVDANIGRDARGRCGPCTLSDGPERICSGSHAPVASVELPCVPIPPTRFPKHTLSLLLSACFCFSASLWHSTLL
jgi:hypothetical protein